MQARRSEAIEMLPQLLDDPRRLLKSVPEDCHKTFHRLFFKRLLVRVDEATGEPKVSADEIRSLATQSFEARNDEHRAECFGPVLG